MDPDERDLGGDPASIADLDPLAAIGPRERAILDFEREWWKYAGAKDQAVRERFSLSPTRYYQLLNRIIDDERALSYDPMLVKRLRRMRSARQRQRAARRLGTDLGN